MKTQLSQFPVTLHAPYSGVYQQQGRMITDADWNAASQIAKDRLDRALDDVIGKGTPAQGGIIAGDQDVGFSIVWGDLYVDGIRADLTSRTDTTAFNLTDQADFPGYNDAPDTAHRLYVDVWERSLTGLEDPSLLDDALHGADTSTRTRTMAQVKLCPQGFDPEDPDQNPPIGEGRLTLTLRAGSDTPDACEPCLDEIDVSGRIGNYAFRVEVHDVQTDGTGAPVRLVLKWSRENGAEAAAVGQEPPGFKASDWIYEFYHAASEGSASESHAGFHHPTVIASGFAPARGELIEGFPDSPPGGFSLVRRWDGYIVLDLNGATWEIATQTIDGDPAPHGADRGQRLSTALGAAQHGHLSEGSTITMSLDTMTLALELADHQHLVGDYWIGVVREARHSAGAIIRDDATPDGILHHYMCLADVADDGTLTLLNKDACKRFQFPQLTNLHADDVCYDNSSCEMPEVGNVQEALDHLCKQKDLKWHNKHLHGWGIVCGLIVECCDPDREEEDDEDPTQCVTLSKGYAIDCEGEDIVVDGPLHIDLLDDVARWDAENPNNAILTEGRGTACLYLATEAGQPVVKVEPHDPTDNGFLDDLLNGTLIGDFVQHCILDLINALTEELSFIEDGQLPSEDGAELVSQERRKFISFWNLVAQIGWKANGPYVWMSRREYDILKELYDRLRDLLSSKTFCAMFNDDSFPPYPFPDTQIYTWFGADQHTNIKADPTGARVYTYGGTDETIHVYDTKTGELTEILRMPVPEGGEITALTCSPDGRLLYVAASVRGEDTVIGLEQFVDVHKFERTMHILCDIIITDMAIDPNDESLIYAVGLGRGLFFLRPDVLSEEEPMLDPMFAFNAVGHMAIDPIAKRIFCTAAASLDDGADIASVPELYDRVAICEMGVAETSFAPTILLSSLPNNSSAFGQDDIAVRPGDTSRVYIVVDGVENQGDKSIITFDVPGGSVTGVTVATLAVENTKIALAFDREIETLYASFADSFRVQAIDGDGIEVRQMRIPVQLSPTDVTVGPNGHVYTVNFLSSTVTSIPRDEVALSKDRLSPLANMRWRMLLAFYALVGNLFQYLKDCFCHHLLVKCPECDGSEKIYLACVEIQGNEVYNICNFGKRKYVQTFMAWNYWLSLVPIIPLMKQAIGKMCCSVLPNFLDKFTDDIAPPPEAPELGAASGKAGPIQTNTALGAVKSYKRTDVATIRRQQFGKLGVYGDIAKDITLTTRAQPFLAKKGVRKETLRNAEAETAKRELERAGVAEVEVRPYDPALADRYAVEFAATPSHLDKSAKVIVYERNGKTVLVTEDRSQPKSIVTISPEDEAEVAKFEERVVALRAERNTLKQELEELNTGLTAAADMRRTLKVEVDSMRPLKELEGMPARTITQLEGAGVRTIGDLSNVSETTLRTARVGQNVAARRELIALAQGRLK
jgi:WD40 repeat protein